MMQLVFALLIVGISPLDHDIHVSICDIEINDRQVELTLKTFLDDLQMAVGLVPGEELPEDYTSADEMISAYISKSIKVKIQDKPALLNVKEMSASQDAVWITITVDIQNPVISMTIKNSFLTEIYSDQTNLVNIKYGKEKKSFLLNTKKKDISYYVE